MFKCNANIRISQSNLEIVDRIMSEIIRPESMAVIKDRLSYSNVFSMPILQIHPLFHAGLAINETVTINRRLSELLGLKVFYQYGDIFCQCRPDYDDNTTEGGLFHNIRIRDRLPDPPGYTSADANADIKAVVRIYNMYKKKLDSELASRRRIQIYAAKNTSQNYSIMHLFTTPPTQKQHKKEQKQEQQEPRNDDIGDIFDTPLRINQLNYDPFIRERQWNTRVATEIARRIGVPLIDIQGVHITLGNIILTLD